ncbi:hypothetical protein L596_001780 [Steinernema carpocapsae]|uniref:Uncharacterized protein n=1 Tax=Steinernema carpocapsae TaxID=34508 RepID=A0A4U8UM45_STECR|nr:hypothetical protein L596_001780 [Steinernema carpocapsae]
MVPSNGFKPISPRNWTEQTSVDCTVVGDKDSDTFLVQNDLVQACPGHPVLQKGFLCFLRGLGKTLVMSPLVLESFKLVV